MNLQLAQYLEARVMPVRPGIIKLPPTITAASVAIATRSKSIPPFIFTERKELNLGAERLKMVEDLIRMRKEKK